MTSPFRRSFLAVAAAFLASAVFLAWHRTPEAGAPGDGAARIWLPETCQVQPKTSGLAQATPSAPPRELSVIRSPTQVPAWAISFGSDLLPDLIHPNAAGAAIIANTLHGAILQR